MVRSLKIASAFVGVIIGAGFASGQEILQYFTSFGTIGIVSALLATVLFAYFGMSLVWLGSHFRAESHHDVIHGVSNRFWGRLIDYILIFTTFGFGVVMVSGGGAALEQQFGMPIIVGNIIMTLLVIFTMMINVNKVLNIIGGMTPFLILAATFISIYSLFAMDQSFASLHPEAQAQPSAVGNWVFSAINYVSFNIALGASMAIVIGGHEKNGKVAAVGGLLGGLTIGILIILTHLAVFSNIGVAATVEMPLLEIANNIHPIWGFLYAIILFGMVYNTATSMFYALGSRFFIKGTGKFKIFTAIAIIAGFLLSFAGFTELVNVIYPLFGVLGLVLMVILFIGSLRMFKRKRRTNS